MERSNNFDVLRLMAALQVAFYHGWRILDLPVPHGGLAWLWHLGMLYPGVPIFFCISGFLIPQSLERNRGRLSKYVEARILRIYPALIAVTCGGAVMLSVLGFFKGVAIWRCAVWFLSTMAWGSNINPDFLRGFGSGVWNGSLWTISVEISFYVLLPVAYVLLDSRRLWLNIAFFSAMVVSAAVFLACDGLKWGQTASASVATKVVWFSLAGNLWMFLFGTLAHRYFDKLRRLFEGTFLPWLLLVTIISCLPQAEWPAWAKAGQLFCSRLALAGTTLSAAFSGRRLAERLLHGQDLSYGLYLYHAPIFNLFCQLGLNGGYAWYLIGGGLSLGIAALSWIAIERPALTMKGVFFKRIRGCFSTGKGRREPGVPGLASHRREY